jgi:hypothetical protein
VRLELNKEKDQNGALKRQVADLKAILGKELVKFDRGEVEAMASYDVSADNVHPPAPATLHDVPIEEQLTALMVQNTDLMEELASWKKRAESLEKLSGTRSADASMVMDWKKRLFSRGNASSPAVSTFKEPVSPTGDE